MHQPMVCSTTLKTTESCSVWLVSGVQSIMMEKNVAFFTLLTISSSTLSPISAMISFWIWLQRKFHFIFFVFNSPQMFVHDRIKLSSIPTVIGNCHYVGHIEHLYALIMPGSSARWHYMAIIICITPLQCFSSRCNKSWLAWSKAVLVLSLVWSSCQLLILCASEYSCSFIWLAKFFQFLNHPMVSALSCFPKSLRRLSLYWVNTEAMIAVPFPYFSLPFPFLPFGLVLF